MAQYRLTQPDPDPLPPSFAPTVYLQIATDDSGNILTMAPPSYRSGDAVMKRLVNAWNDYLIGSPTPPAIISEFIEYVQTNHGTAYTVRRIT